MAAALVDGGRILPVLDGLDQISPGLRAEAIAAINRLGSEIPMVVTSRETEYRQAARSRPWLVPDRRHRTDAA